MSLHETSPEIAHMALEAKVLARRNSSRRNLVLLVGILSGVSVAALWIAYSPLPSPAPKTKLVIGVLLGILAASLRLFWCQKYYYPGDEKCPVCGYSWEIKEGSTVPLSERMESWDRCPGCGLLMSDALLKLALRYQPASPDRARSGTHSSMTSVTLPPQSL
jgi:hypothetical protein